MKRRRPSVRYLPPELEPVKVGAADLRLVVPGPRPELRAREEGDALVPSPGLLAPDRVD